MIIIDTREQTPLEPWVFRKGERVILPTVRRLLETGDYSVEGAEGHVAIERKSIVDLASTLYGSAETAAGERAGHLDRFRAELLRMQPFARRWWLIEGSPDELDMHIIDRFRRINPASAHALVAAIACDYNIPVIWAGNRLRAAHFVGVTLGRIAEQIANPKEAAKARARGLDLPWLQGAL